jgi:hypothetical protein
MDNSLLKAAQETLWLTYENWYYEDLDSSQTKATYEQRLTKLQYAADVSLTLVDYLSYDDLRDLMQAAVMYHTCRRIMRLDNDGALQKVDEQFRQRNLRMSVATKV